MAELSRRRVLRVVATYAIGTFGALQSADVIVSALSLPHYLMTGLVVLTFVGLPVTAALAWVFDLTPQGVVRTPKLGADGTPQIVGTQTIGAATAPSAALSGSPPAQPRHSRLALVLGALAIALGISGAGLWWRARNKKPLPRDVVAVLPFTVRGAEQYAYLREGIGELLSAGISGGGALRAIDEQALARAIKESGGEMDDEAGRGLARRFGAGLFVIGTVLEVKDRLRLHAQLYDADGGVQPVADANAEGDAGSLFALVDDLLRQLRPGLVASGHAAANAPIVALAESTTSSIAALKAFIEGEQALREGENVAALHALERSVAADANFALAQYRLAVVASWTEEIPLGRAALEHALQSRDKLPPRERDLIEAFSAYWHGRAHDAETRYRAILEKNPDDAESWYQLGEVLFHDGPLQGHPERDAKEAFRRATVLQPEQKMYAYHLDDIGRVEGDQKATARLDEHALKMQGAPPEVMSWQGAWLAGNEALQRELEKKIVDPKWLLGLATLTVEHRPGADGLGAADAFLVRALATPDLEASFATTLRLVRGQLACVAGKRSETYRIFGSELAGLPAVALNTINAQMAISPFFPHAKEELTRAVAGLPSLLPTEDPAPDYNKMGFGSNRRPAVNARRAHDYLAGRLAIATGDYPGAEAAAQSLQASTDADESTLGADMSYAVRAHAAAAQGHGPDALALLEKMSGGQPLAVIGDSGLVPAGDRWLHADLLLAAGKAEEALHWLETIGADNMSCWIAPVRLRRAQVLEQLGKKKEALEQYRLFADLWRDSDPDLRPLVDGARGRMTALVGEHP